MAADGPIRAEVHFEGHVQGVGFRYTSERTAVNYRVVGFVQNLPDGRVRLVAEGEKSEVDQFLEDLARRMEGHIHHQDREDATATGEFTNFRARQ